MPHPDVGVAIAKMNGAGNGDAGGRLQRSSWKAEAIRRGDLKISGPIPITEDVPLNEEEEREYAAKHKDVEAGVEGPVLRPETPIQQQQQSTTAQSSDGSVRGSSRGVVVVIDKEKEIEGGLVDSPHRLRHKRSSSALRQRQSDMRISAGSPFLLDKETKTTSTPTQQKKKRKSGLRGVFRKMFGRRSRGEEDGVAERERVKGHGYHSSDPGLLTTSPNPTKPTQPSPQRISSLPIHNIQPINPLAQHLPFPMNVNAPQEASPPHEYLTFDASSSPPPTLHRRRATLPSLVMAQSEAQALSASWGHAGDDKSIPSPEIGIAVSGSPTYARRRSQSAGALRELARKQEEDGRVAVAVAAMPVVERRRSEEIRYWRNSYRSVSVYSAVPVTPTAQVARPETAQTRETRETEETATATAAVREEGTVEEEEGAVSENSNRQLADSPPLKALDPALSASEPSSQPTTISIIPLPADEPFNFGNLKHDFSPPPSSPYSDQTPHARSSDTAIRAGQNRDQQPATDIETRLQTLESTISTLSTSIHRLSSRSNRQTIILESAPKGRKSRGRSSGSGASGEAPSEGSRQSSLSSSKTLSSKHDPILPIQVPEPSQMPTSADLDPYISPSTATLPNTISLPLHSPTSPLSTTIDPALIPPNPNPPPTTPESQFAAIYTILRHERAARKELENRVLALTAEVLELRDLISRGAVGVGTYPTPSPDMLVLRGAGEKDEEEREEGVRSRFSISEGEEEDAGKVRSPDEWATPMEGKEFFGRESRERVGAGEGGMF